MDGGIALVFAVHLKCILTCRYNQLNFHGGLEYGVCVLVEVEDRWIGT
jgi:hypothetical protein